LKVNNQSTFKGEIKQSRLNLGDQNLFILVASVSIDSVYLVLPLPNGSLSSYTVVRAVHCEIQLVVNSNNSGTHE